MKIRLIITVICCLFFTSFYAPKKIHKKVLKTIQTTYNIDNFSLELIQISPQINGQLKRTIKTESLYKIVLENELMGYVYLDSAPSKTASFDFLVLFDTDLIITKSKILAYREEYGGEIGSNRWLKQFIGATKNDFYRPNDNIVAIAGATISVNSMTNAINGVLFNVGKLQELKVL